MVVCDANQRLLMPPPPFPPPSSTIWHSHLPYVQGDLLKSFSYFTNIFSGESEWGKRILIGPLPQNFATRHEHP